jgi:hypothetical protein
MGFLGVGVAGVAQVGGVARAINREDEGVAWAIGAEVDWRCDFSGVVSRYLEVLVE